MIKTISSLHWLSRPLIFALALMLIIGAGFPTPTRAQDDPETVWYWATTPEGIVAYTLDGETNLIYTAPDLYGKDYFAARLAPDTAILRGGGAFYLVTAETAQNLPIPPSALQLRPYSYRHPYVVLMETEMYLPGVVLDVETFEVVSLAGELPSPPRFLPDGVTLRYVGLEIIDGQFLYPTLYEQNLVSGELIELATLAPESVAVSSADGNYWWFRSENGDIQTVGDPDPQYTEWLLDWAQVHGNWIWHLVPGILEGYSLVDDLTFTLTLPENMVWSLDYVNFLPDGSIILVGYTTPPNLRHVWVQNPDGTLLELGEIDYGEMASEYFSADGQWAVALGRTPEGGMTLRLWDLTTREIVYEAPYEDYYSYHLFAGDTVGLYYTGRSQILYWNGKATPLDLYANSLYQYPDNFFQILSGGQALYEAPDGGIYRFDAPTESMTLLVPGGKYISVYELR